MERQEYLISNLMHFNVYSMIAKQIIFAIYQDPVVRSSIKFNHGLSVNQSFKS